MLVKMENVNYEYLLVKNCSFRKDEWSFLKAEIETSKVLSRCFK